MRMVAMIAGRTAMLGAALSALALAVPAAAQDAEAPEKVRQMVVYGQDSCAPSSEDEIVVCVQMPESERYRVPKMFRDNPNAPQNIAWAERVESMRYVGRFGTDSCSPVGAGGFTGCMAQMIAAARAEKKAADKTSWAALIAEERNKRLAGIDAAAAEVESAVVAEEKRMAEARAKAEALEEQGGAPVTTAPKDGDSGVDAPLPDPKSR